MENNLSKLEVLELFMKTFEKEINNGDLDLDDLKDVKRGIILTDLLKDCDKTVIRSGKDIAIVLREGDVYCVGGHNVDGPIAIAPEFSTRTEEATKRGIEILVDYVTKKRAGISENEIETLDDIIEETAPVIEKEVIVEKDIEVVPTSIPFPPRNCKIPKWDSENKVWIDLSEPTVEQEKEKQEDGKEITLAEKAFRMFSVPQMITTDGPDENGIIHDDEKLDYYSIFFLTENDTLERLHPEDYNVNYAEAMQLNNPIFLYEQANMRFVHISGTNSAEEEECLKVAVDKILNPIEEEIEEEDAVIVDSNEKKLGFKPSSVMSEVKEEEVVIVDNKEKKLGFKSNSVNIDTNTTNGDSIFKTKSISNYKKLEIKKV